MRCSAAELFAPRLPTGARFVSRSRFWLTPCFVLATTTCGRPLRRAGLEIARNARRLNIRPDSRAALRCPYTQHSPRMRSGPSAFTQCVLLRHKECAGGESGNWTMTLPASGGWTRRGPRHHAATVLIHLSSGRIQGVRTAAAGTPASVVEGGTRPDRPQGASQERLRRRLVSVLHL